MDNSFGFISGCPRSDFERVRDEVVYRSKNMDASKSPALLDLERYLNMRIIGIKNPAGTNQGGVIDGYLFRGVIARVDVEMT